MERSSAKYDMVNIKFEIYDINGKSISKGDNQKATNSENISKYLDPGLYYIYIHFRDKEYSGNNVNYMLITNRTYLRIKEYEY